MDSYRSYRAINCQFVPGFECIYIHTVTCYTLYLSQVSCTVARGNPPFSILNFSRIHYLRSKWIY